MSDEEKKAIEQLKELITAVMQLEDNDEEITLDLAMVGIFQRILNLIEKQEKVIDKLSWELSKNFCPDIDTAIIDCKTIGCNKCIKQYFYRKVENNE